MLSRLLNGTIIAVFAVASATAALAATPTISTYSSWDKSLAIRPFGCPASSSTPTYGQVITVPSGMHHLNQFTVWWQASGGAAAAMVGRAHVYRWDATNRRPMGRSLFDSAPLTISLSDSAFHPQNFFFSNLVVTPGVQYVIFASIDWEYVDCANSQLAWGFIAGDAYSGGSFLFLNDAGDDRQWKTTQWSASGDLAFKAYLSP